MANSDKRIIYLGENGGIAVISPCDDTSSTVEEIAAKDVPTGSKYKIVDYTDVPTDRSFRDAWTVSEDNLTDGVGA